MLYVKCSLNIYYLLLKIPARVFLQEVFILCIYLTFNLDFLTNTAPSY